MAHAQLLPDVPQSLKHGMGDLSLPDTAWVVAVMRAAHAELFKERKKCAAGNKLMVGGEVSTPGLCQHKGKQMDLNCLQLQFHSVLNAHGVMQKPRPAEVEGAPGDGLVQPFALSRVTQRWLPRMMSSWSLASSRMETPQPLQANCSCVQPPSL